MVKRQDIIKCEVPGFRKQVEERTTKLSPKPDEMGRSEKGNRP